MNLFFDLQQSLRYHSIPQKVRVMSETWLKEQAYCPNCGSDISKYGNNQPVRDFYCIHCNENFELKSKNGGFVKKVNDGAYKTMMENLLNFSHPNFFLLNYEKSTFLVKDLCIIPKHFFTSKIIEKRKPLSANARRKGWVGCLIDLSYIPQSGRIYYIKNSVIEDKEKVLHEWKRTLFLRDNKLEKSKGWLLDVMNIIDKNGKTNFTLNEIYQFELELKKMHPENNFIKDKIRQQLQVLRDRGYLKFKERGKYSLK